MLANATSTSITPVVAQTSWCSQSRRLARPLRRESSFPMLRFVALVHLPCEQRFGADDIVIGEVLSLIPDIDLFSLSTLAHTAACHCFDPGGSNCLR